MKILPDDLSLREVLGSLVVLPKFIIDTIKEEWLWWTKLYAYEMSTPLDFDEEHRGKCLAESLRRLKAHQDAQNRNLGGFRR